MKNTLCELCKEKIVWYDDYTSHGKDEIVHVRCNEMIPYYVNNSQFTSKT